MFASGCLVFALIVGAAGFRQKDSAGTRNFAVLQHLRNKAHTKAASKLVDRLSALLERGQEDPGPDSSEVFADIVGELIEETRDNFKPRIEAAHVATQTEIDNRVSAVETSSTDVQTAKSNAIEKDRDWNECIRQERIDRIAVETARRDLAQAIEDEVQPCADEEAARSFEDSITLEAVACDIERQGGECSFTIYKASSQKKVTDVETHMRDKREIYDDAFKRCADARDAITTADTNLKSAISTWGAQRASCIDVGVDRTEAVCNLGAALKVKCQNVDSYRHLVDQIGERDNEWSHQDREDEYASMQVTDCLLTKSLDGSPLVAGDVTTCDDSLQSVGDLDLKDADFNLYVSDPYYTCKEDEITLTGQHWKIPDPEESDPPSTRYEEIFEYAEPINPYEGFTICEDAHPVCKEAMTGDGTDYRGCQDKTVDGDVCQEWDKQSPHGHVYRPEAYPDAGLDSNYCRNPDGHQALWCYTTGATRWGYCVPKGAAAPGKGACKPDDESLSGEGVDYRGCQDETMHGYACQRWDEQSPHVHSYRPEDYVWAGLDSNYCRNPGNDHHTLWCYTTGAERWDNCQPKGVVKPGQGACSQGNEALLGVNGKDYRGCQTRTRSGRTCQRWDTQSPHGHTYRPENRHNEGLDSNYCRNPDGESAATIWCFTTTAGFFTRWEYCDPLSS